MLVVTALVIAALLSPSTPFTVSDFLKDGVKGTWDSAPPNGATLFFCSKDLWTTLKDLSGSDFTVKIAQPHHWLDTLESVGTVSPHGLHTLVVDWQCPMADQLVRKASNLSIIRSPYRWLVLNVTEEEQTQESCQDLASEISANGSSFAEGKAADADVVLVCRGANSLTLVDLWGPVAPVILGKWYPDIENRFQRFQSDRSPPAARRLAAGFNGYVFRAAFVISNNDTYDHLDDGVHKQWDFMTKFNYEVCHIVAKMLNGTLKASFDTDWGYVVNGSWTGIIGQLVRREAEIGGTPTAVVSSRLSVQTYLNYQTPAEGVFIFKEPPMSTIYNLFTRPFPQSLWLAIFSLVSLGALLLYVVVRVEEVTGVEEHLNSPEMAEGRKRKLDSSWSDVVLLTFGAVCQQGSPTEARGVPGRIVTLFLFLGILFFYTSYSASIVALLQSTTSNIQHYKDFLDSRIKLGIENISYNVYFARIANDTYRRRIYEEKLTDHGRRNPFMSLQEGMNRVRSSYFAFFSAKSNIYQTITDTFQEHEKCGLREIENFLVVSNPHMTVGKWSTFAEVIRITLRRIQERGIRQKQLKKFMPFKPICVHQGGNFNSVSIIDCYFAFIILSVGVGIASFLLLAENFVFPRVNHLLQRNAFIVNRRINLITDAK